MKVSKKLLLFVGLILNPLIEATAFIKQQGFADVRHLKGGIINYLQSVPKNESLFDGECFVFDHRVAITHTSERADNVSKLPKV